MKKILWALLFSTILTSTGTATEKNARVLISQISEELSEVVEIDLSEINENSAYARYSYNQAAKELENLLHPTKDTPNLGLTLNSWISVTLDLQSDFGYIENGINSEITKQFYLMSLDAIKKLGEKGNILELTEISNGKKTINGHDVFLARYTHLSNSTKKETVPIKNSFLITGIRGYILEINISSTGNNAEIINDIYLRIIRVLLKHSDPQKP